MRLLLMVVILNAPCSMFNVFAQINIAGSVYGGGNAGNTGGNTKVTVRAGDLNEVYGGARMANVNGNAFVNIDGEHASSYVVINKVYGGNDIAGTIGSPKQTTENKVKKLPTELTEAAENGVTKDWDAFVRVSSREKVETTGEEDDKTTTAAVYIGQLFGGGNGEYTYINTKDNDVVTHIIKDKDGKVLISTTDDGFSAPELNQTYLEVVGGSIVYAYGGGNNATVKKNTVICVDNPSEVVNHIYDHGTELLTTERFQKGMGINTGLSYPGSAEFQIGRFFGGNNVADMTIRPTWNLKSGKIRNLYSGGNRGHMTSKEGLLLEIPATSTIVVDNVYGGCRMADVHPMDGTQEVPLDDVQLSDEDADGKPKYKFPAGLAARVLVRGGDVNNVYGGNDVTGKVYGGNAVGIYTDVRGDVYGGGNGAYPYTDNPALIGDDIYGDLYYDPSKVIPGKPTASSVEALNAFRPNAEQVSVRLYGTPDNPTIIGGAVYVGGNSATLKPKDTEGNYMAHVKIGSYVIADRVFLGNNGAEMTKYNPKKIDDNNTLVEREGVLRTYQTEVSGKPFNSMDLTKEAVFAEYMDGVTMDIKPQVVFDSKTNGDPDNYQPYTSSFGSFYCGGNVGSVRADGVNNINFNHKVIIFEKLVGGCNSAYVAKTDYNAAYDGGIIPVKGKTTGLTLNLSGLKLVPQRWKMTTDGEGHEVYDLDDKNNRQLEWNTVKHSFVAVTSGTTLTEGKLYFTSAEGTGAFRAVGTEIADGSNYFTDGYIKVDNASGTGTATADDISRRLLGGNIYGGCYTSGHVEGDVVINIDESLVVRDEVFDVTDEEDILYENTERGSYTIKTRNSGVILSEQGMDVLGSALNVFGGGYGEDSEIWGSTTVNLNRGYVFQIFGGGEAGAIGRGTRDDKGNLSYDKNKDGKVDEKDYDLAYSTYINLHGDASLPGVARKTDDNSLGNMAECEFIYGGAFEGQICGDTHIYLGNGRIFNTFAGSCNADILGHTETYIGRMVKTAQKDRIGALAKANQLNKEENYDSGFPWVRDHLYGGNDLGGSVFGNEDFNVLKNRIRTQTDLDYMTKPRHVAAYMEYTQGRVRNILGGCFGDYDYSDPAYISRIQDKKNPEKLNRPFQHNSFVNFRPTTNPVNSVEKVFGAGEGASGDREGDKLQEHSYMLIDIPEGVSNFAYTEIFGAGAYNGLGMRDFVKPDANVSVLNEVSAIIDLMHGQVGAAYGGSYEEGVTRRTVVNVPEVSTIKIGSIFAGAYGNDIYLPCDVYDANVNYLSKSEDAYLIYDPERKDENTGAKLGHPMMKGAIYGGNNFARRTLYGKVNINVPVRQKHYQYNMTTATVYGAGCGSSTWNEYTEVNLKAGASVYEVYGGGEAGGVMSAESVQTYINQNPYNIEADAWKAAWTLGGGYDSESLSTGYVNNVYTNLDNPLARSAEVDDRNDKAHYKKYNTNVIINKGAYVGNYAYGGGRGLEEDQFVGSGDVYGTTYIALLGGTVNKDIYAAGTVGKVYNVFGADFTASTTAFIAGGTLRNVFGGGWKGDVGLTTMTVSADGKSATYDEASERPGETHVVIGIREDQTKENLEETLKKVLNNDKATTADYGFFAGVPAIQRNAYGGGEGGAVFGSTYLTINNGYVGYVHLNADEKQDEQGKKVTTTEQTKERYEAKINDETYFDENGAWAGENRLKDSGNAFGGGYDVQSSVDFSTITMWGGTVRNSLVGGGEIATIGRGAIEASGPSNVVRTLKGIYKAGKTNIEMFNGHVLRNVFGGGKGYNMFGYGQQGTLYMDGYVFGQTEVHIHGGEIGTDEGLTEGYGNVFGAGDIGYVYSPSINSTKTKQKIGTGSPGHIYYYDAAGNLSEDCKVVVSPYLQVKDPAGITINGHAYKQYDYVSTDDLNTLPKKNDNGQYLGGWENLFTGDADGDTERGIYIHNAVFAGGNVSSNSDQTYANATTVYGNTTATLYDAYHRDFITVGTEHTGGIYGGGNLSVVDGYRELNITNYGTDYYGLKQTISIDEYRRLSNRERAYFQLEYKCKTDVTINGVFYEEGKRLTEEEYLKLLDNEAIADQVKNSFEPYGFCSIYAGRLLNTIQRADLCGVYGSRMVLQGAKDRVAEVGEDIDYTINRVGELSLNQQQSVRAADTGDDALHGNYFGIYSLVNCLGNLTSDVRFGDYYVNGSGVTEKDKTYYSYKSAKPTSSDRNKGQSYNQVALASGVFLELTTENSTKEKKDYGYVTGVIELDLINVKKDLVGGGFVYAKNEHRVPMYYPNKSNVILSEYNMGKEVNGKTLRDEARTYRQYYYTSDNLPTGDEAKGATVVSGDDSHVFETMVWQTSGNFIHPSKRIVDDCYPINNAYVLGADPYSEAHYWYVKGEVYIYDQKVSAYTGSANAYSKEVHLPLTITAASNGKLQLLNVKPNLYAYRMPGANGNNVKIGSENDASGEPIDKVFVNNESDSYGLNDVISWWDWHQLSASDRQYFVTETYLNCVTCTIDGVEYEQGTYVMDQTDYDKFMSGTHDIRDAQGEHFRDDDGHDIGKTFVFRSSNNISHETGYVLTFDMDTPKVWDDWYSPTTGSSVDGKIMKLDYQAQFTDGMTDAQRQAVLESWREGPTFTPTESGVYGKQTYKRGEVITEATYQNAGEGQDKMEKAYVATEQVTYTYNGVTKTVNPGTAISETEYNGIGSIKNSFAPAWMCISSVTLTKVDYLLYGELKTAEEIKAMKQIEGKLVTDAEIDAALTPAYICTADGEYGGQRFETGTNYSAIQAWSSLPVADRTKFSYNFDALDLLTNSEYLTVDPNVTTSPSLERTADAFHSPYTDQVEVEYQAVYADDATKEISYNDGTKKSFTKGTDGATITNKEFETIRNDKRHYTHVETKNNGDDVYIAMNNFVYLGTPYGRGQVVDADIYNANSSDVEAVRFETAGEWYYCYEDYKAEDGTTVSKGTKITKAEYGTVPNYQQYFIIQGQEPTETTTLYVSRESNAYDVMSEKIITVVYQYTYYEDEDDGSVKLTNELHVVNIHLDLESGVPQIGLLSPPGTVLPGTAVGLKAPEVNPGLYEVITNGWELYLTQDDAENHRNGMAIENNNTPVYWYQNQKNYIAFYSKTYLGKTYSNPVPLSVANYHDLDKIMQDKEHHMYVDKSSVERPSKIYLDNRKCESDENKSELDLLKDFFDLSLQTQKATSGETAGHEPLDNHVRGAGNLEFILNSDLSPKKYTNWTPIGNATQCFSGNLHGDGHTVSGLSASLFGSLCGNVYNLGVTGSFTGAGVADTGDGYVANCWVKTTGTPAAGVKAVFGNPSATDGSTQVFNCYYPESNSGYTAGAARKMPDKAFYNGEVAHSLNGYYLHKRYYDHSQTNQGSDYRYLVDVTDSEGKTDLEEKTGKYGAEYEKYRYVEDRYGDGDFRYADGTIPESTDVRLRTVTEGEGDDAVTTTYFDPIWPDDYLFFGQMLNYGHIEGATHQDYPSAINRSNGRVQNTAGGNRVYRAPAYFRSNKMEVAYYNPYAVFAQTKKGDAKVTAYQNMTAIDFTGFNDVTNGYQKSEVSNGNTTGTTHFFPPLLDHDGLTGFQNIDLTRNLLVYAPSAVNDPATFAVLDEALNDVVYAEDEDDTSTEVDETFYRRVGSISDAVSQGIMGHMVLQAGEVYIADRDHFLVDRQDFNAPISYSFDDNYRMWYQRKPDNFVDSKKGWESVSLPFTAELVTTDDKGEITHFYKSSETGHEYWLREYQGGNKDSKDDKTFIANMTKPEAGAGKKHFTNTFLWDYYYSHDDAKNDAVDQDVNRDDYQKRYYSESHIYNGYPHATAATPYIIGLPGKRYYEFDLSGEWEPKYRLSGSIANLGSQTVTFASTPGVTIKVSDEELKETVTSNGFTFWPSYMAIDLAKETAYLLNKEGSSFEKNSVATKAIPFRPYFTGSGNGTRGIEQIIFGNDDSGLEAEEEHGDPREGATGTLKIWTKKGEIFVESSLSYTTDVRVVTPAGITVAAFAVKAGETVTVQADFSGMYVVYTLDGRYIKKLSVKK